MLQMNNTKADRIRFGEIGVGSWGGNIVRNLAHMNTTEMLMVSDLDQGRLDHIRDLYPTVKTTTDFQHILQSDEIDAVAIATPVSTHFDLASAALERGKHVFIEKPMTLTVEESAKLVELADDADRLCMVGHTFLYTPAVEWMKEFLDSGGIGNVQYISSRRMSLGLIQKTCNVVHDLAPHDISIICYLLGQSPIAVNAIGAAYVNPGIEEIASITLHFPDSVVAFVQNSWLDPLKIRNLTMVGDSKMVVYDDIHPTDKIQVHDKSVEKPSYSDTYGDFAYSYKYGDIVIPKLQGGEPIRRQLDHFVDCITGNAKCRSSAEQGRKVVEIITCINESIKNNGARVPVEGGEWV
jgi:predicted dehydrogenase